MNFIKLWYSMGAGMVVGICYGLLFTILQTRVHVFKNRLFLLGAPLFRLFCFFGLHYLMRHILEQLNPAIYGITLFVSFILSVQFLSTHVNNASSTR